MDQPAPLPAAFVAKYRERIAELGLSPAEIRRHVSGDDPTDPGTRPRLARPVDATLVVGRGPSPQRSAARAVAFGASAA
jgi:hypothetical protein